MSTQLEQVAAKARLDKRCQFTSLMHIMTAGFLKETWKGMNRHGASGADGQTMEAYGNNLDNNVTNLIERLKANQYRAPAVRRVEIPKGDGKTRALGIPTVEDRLLQRAVARILSAIYETDFLECSFGFRPKRSAHDAIHAVRQAVVVGKTRRVFEADIKSYFDRINHIWMMRFLKHRIADTRLLNLIGKWLSAGVMINGVVSTRQEGSPQGGPISPLLANIYLHYVLDLWYERRIKRSIYGESKLIRYADDFVVCFQHVKEPAKFEKTLVKRFAEFNLEIAPEKTRTVVFGRFAKKEALDLGIKNESFDFLGFKHVSGISRKGKFDVVRIPSKKSVTKFCTKTYDWLRKHMHWRVRDQQRELTAMLNGFYNYFALPNCLPKLVCVRQEVGRQWRTILRRRSQKGKSGRWCYLKTQDWFYLPTPKMISKSV